MRRASVRWKSRRRFQLLSKFSTDFPPTSCMKPLSLPPLCSKQATRWAQSAGSKTRARMRIGAGWDGSLGCGDPLKRASIRSASSRGATSTTRSIGSRITQDRSAPNARAISSPSHRNTIEGKRASSAISGPEPDSATTAKKAAVPSSTRRRLAESATSAASAPGEAIDPRNASAMARPGKGSKADRWRPELSRKALSPGWAGDFSAKSTCSDIDFPSIAPRLATSRRTREARGKNLILMDNRVPPARIFAPRFAEVNASLSPWT